MIENLDIRLWDLLRVFIPLITPFALATHGLFAIWVLLDGRERKARGAILWAVGTMLLAPLVAAVYVAKRPLRAAETRKGGTGWNILKNFASLWFMLMAAAAVWIAVRFTFVERDELGLLLGLFVIALLWFFPTVFALVLGLFLKKSSVVEKRPYRPIYL